MFPNSLNSIGFISEFDELATHSGTFVNSLNSLCFTSEMEGFTIPAIRQIRFVFLADIVDCSPEEPLPRSTNSLCFPSEFRFPIHIRIGRRNSLGFISEMGGVTSASTRGPCCKFAMFYKRNRRIRQPCDLSISLCFPSEFRSL